MVFQRSFNDLYRTFKTPVKDLEVSIPAFHTPAFFPKLSEEHVVHGSLSRHLHSAIEHMDERRRLTSPRHKIKAYKPFLFDKTLSVSHLLRKPFFEGS